MMHTENARAEHVIGETWPNHSDPGGMCDSCGQFWGAQCETLDWCDELDARNGEIRTLKARIAALESGAQTRGSLASPAFTRVDIITGDGRRQFGWPHEKLEYMVQDEGRTLKVIIRDLP